VSKRTLTIENFRAIQATTIELDSITLLAGPNGAGKTSILQALSAALTGELMPVRNEFWTRLHKKNSDSLIHSGASGASIMLDAPLGNTRVDYPAGTRISEGKPSECSRMAAGVDSFIELKYPERVQAINDLLRSEPKYDDLAAALAPLKISDKGLGILWGTITAQGWDAAHDGAKRKGAELKGAWKQITHHTGQYGSQLAEGWLPAAWTEDLRTATLEQLAAELTDRRSWLESAIGSASVGDAEIARLKQVSDLLPKMREQYAELEKAQVGNRKNETDISTGLKRLRAEVETTTQCPHCGEFVVIKGDRIDKPCHNPQEPNDLQDRIKHTERALTDIQQVIQARQTELTTRATQITQAEQAAKQLAELTTRTPDAEPGTHGTVEQLRAEVKHAEDRLAAWKSYREAAKTHQMIQANQQVVDILAPDGLRVTRLQEALTVLNSRIAAIIGAAGWDAVTIEADTQVMYAGRPYMLASDAQKFRARTAIQAAWAMIDGSLTVLIDVTADLDGVSKNGLIRLAVALRDSKIPDITGPTETVIAMAAADRSKMPDISRVGGCGYWIERGVVAPQNGGAA